MRKTASGREGYVGNLGLGIGGKRIIRKWLKERLA
jgi:hypothetical protein